MHAQKSTHMITNKPLAVAVDVDAAVVAVPKRQATERTQAHVRTSVVSAVGSKRSQRTACLPASRGECGCVCARAGAGARARRVAVYLYFCQVFNQQSSDYSYFGACVMNRCTSNECVCVSLVVRAVYTAI